MKRSLPLPYIFFTLLLLICFRNSSYAQDPRVSQYRAIPLLVSPAQTGDFNGNLRFVGLYARVDNDAAFNNFYNASLDWRIGEKGRWAVGFNYLQTGSPQVPISGKNAGISVGREFFIDRNKFQQLRLGFQASYIYGYADEAKAPYDRLLDVRTFRLWHPENDLTKFKGSSEYLNYSVGAKYKLTLDRLKIETGFSAYNITNPEYNFIYKGSLLKRYRVNALSSIYYQPKPKTALKFEHYSWKEGIYLRDFNRRRDTTEIHETTYSLTLYKYLKNKSFNFGMYSRSWQAVYALLGMDFNEKIGINVSYEVPILKKYYNVSHFEVSLNVYPFGKRKKMQDVQKQIEEKNNRLTSQMTAILPFGTGFCLPCITGQPTINITVPDSVQKKPVPCEDTLSVVSREKIKSDSSFTVNIPRGLQRVPEFYKDTIYYDFDKYNIRTDASVILNKVSGMMKNNNSLTLNIKSHTDLRGSIPYNKTLSQNRANSATDYLTKGGIDWRRITHLWYGELVPINQCEKCNDVLQQKNRRSELYLSGFKYRITNAVFPFGDDSVTNEELKKRINQFIALDNNLPSNFNSDNKVSLYTVHITTVVKGEKDTYSYLEGLNSNMFSTKDTNCVRYFFGIFNNVKTAQEMAGKLKSLGFKKAYVKTLESK